MGVRGGARRSQGLGGFYGGSAPEGLGVYYRESSGTGLVQQLDLALTLTLTRYYMGAVALGCFNRLRGPVLSNANPNPIP